MKNVKRIIFLILALTLALSVTLSLASCDEVYTAEETDGMINELRTAIDANKAELDAKIVALTAEYKAKDDALLAEIAADKAELAELKSKYDADLASLNAQDAANEAAISALNTEYTAKVAELNKADADNKAAIEALNAEHTAKVAELNKADADNKAAIEALNKEYTEKVALLDKADKDNRAELDALNAQYALDLKALQDADTVNETAINNLKSTYEAKVQAIEADITAANSKIDSNKTALDASIAALSNSYDTKIGELNKLIEDIEAANTTQSETIADIETYFNNKIAEIEKNHQEEIKTLLDRIESLESIERPADCTVTFDSNGGSDIDSQTVGHGKKATEPEAPTKDGYTFLGWYVGEEQWSFSGYIVTENITLTAKWFRNGTDGLNYNLEISNGEFGMTVTGFSGTETDIIIAESVNGYKVVRIDDSAFSGKSNIKSILIPNTIVSIGSSAFYNCTSLSSITIPDSVTSIGSSAFYNCTSIEEIYFNATAMNDLSSYNNVFYNAGQNGDGIKVVIGKNVTKIPAYLFYLNSYSSYLPKITSVEFEEGSVCKSIGNYAFYESTSLTSVTIGNSVTSIGDYAFSDCTSLTSVTIPDSVTSIGNYAFEDCTSLTIVTIGNGVTSIGAYAFYDCTSLASVTIGNSVTKIGYSAFYNCSSLTSITIPDSVTSIVAYAFSDCTSLASVTIGNSVTEICDGAFRDCTSLTSITIPDSVTSIGDSAFYDCTSIEEIYFNATAMNDLSSSNYVFYNAGQNGDGIKVLIGKNVTKIPAYLFDPYYSDSSYSPKITSVEFEEGSVCKRIGNYAFSECTSLTSVTIPDSVTSIGVYAFRYCSSLISVTIGNGVTTIASHAFEECTSLASLTIGNSVTSIGEWAFSDCTNLEEIYFNATAMNDLRSYYYVFYNAGKNGDGIKVVIGKNVTKIPAYLFNPDSDSSYSPKITSVEFEEGSVCTSIRDFAFQNCKNLKTVNIPVSVTNIGYSAFSGCSSLTDIYYGGTEVEWNKIYVGSNNSYLSGATVHYTEEEEKGETI